MNRIDKINERYALSGAIARTGVEVVAVGDPAGARFNAAVRRLTILVKDEGPGYLDDLAAAAKALRWRRMTQPQPLAFNPVVLQLAREVERHSRRLTGAIAEQDLLDELSASAAAVAISDSVLGAVLLRSCLEVGSKNCVVVAASKPAAVGLAAWMQEQDVLVLTAGELEREKPKREHAYVVGPPRFYRSSLVTAPVTSGVSFLLPAWFGDRSVPSSAIAPYAEGALRIHAHVLTQGDTAEPEMDLPAEPEAEYLPQPAWGARQSGEREPTNEEAEAHKILLSGGLAMWLDDGERIRSLDPDQPVGERVAYIDIQAVRAGTYLLLRQGETERGALYQAAIARLAHGGAVDAAQVAWKQLLAEKLQTLGYRKTVRELRAAGVTTADRARAWTNPSLTRPHSDQDFERLLRWLGVNAQPTFGYATMLRKSLYRVSAEVREKLEKAVSAADLSELEAVGHLSLDLEADGFRGILATRVLAISPFTEIVSRHDARVPFKDGSGRWLE
jgi:hypothetical protein